MAKCSSKTISDLKKILKPNKFKKIFILTGKNSFFLSGAKNLINKVISTQECFYYFKKSKIPVINELIKIIVAIKKFNPDLILAIGGGTVLDYAKIANSIDDIENLENKIKKANYKINKRKPLLTIPTTAGSGAEMTSNAVIYIGKIKYSVESERLIPDFFLLVPELVIGLKRKFKSSAGFDAIAQSVESLLSKKSNSQSVLYATKALKLCLSNYIDHIKNPNIDNTLKMCLAASFSGRAISISKTTAPHALSYPFTAHFGINHGHAVSLTFNDFLNFNYENIVYADCNFNLKSRYKILFNLTKTSNINEFDMYIKSLKKKARLETNFKKLNIDINKSIPLILDGVNLQRLSNNPVRLKITDLKSILKKNNE